MERIFKKFTEGNCDYQEFRGVISAFLDSENQENLNKVLWNTWEERNDESCGVEKEKFERLLQKIHHNLNR